MNNKKRILVTGANGLLGRGVVQQLLNDGCEIIATDFDTSSCDPRANLKPCDLFRIENPFTYFDKPEIVLHLAWRNGFIHNHSSHIEDLPKHYEFIKKMAESGVSQISVMGTMHEIGFFEGMIEDSSVPNPVSLYGIAKDTLRRLTFYECQKNSITCQWLRAFYIITNAKNGASIFSKIALEEEKQTKTFPFTSGTNKMDFLHYPEFCYKVASAVEQNEVTGIINVCSGKPEKLSDVIENFIAENGYKIRLDYGKFPDRPYDSKAVWGDNTKIQMIIDRRNKKV